ncbi:MAG TPA: ATP-grasp domain-containing protein [Terriglobia bacterium]|nr:ATP-grasp domain-containing protein [Terriglobia bacterium]
MAGDGALVIGADYRALGVVRSLGRHGIQVWVLTNEHRVATTSRYAHRHSSWPRGDGARQLAYLLDMCDQHKLDGWTVFPTDDETTAFLSRHHSIVSKRFRMITPPWEVIRWCYDKRLTHRIAGEIGLHQPRTYVPATRQEVAVLDCTFPVILKPAFKPDINPFTHAKAWRADDRETLVSSYDRACRLVDPGIIMVQEWIPDSGADQFSYAALCLEGHPQVSMTARRTRQYPMDFGRASSYVESLELPEIEEPSRRLLKAIRLNGLVEVEYKRDPRDGFCKLLDINSRVWGWHTLGLRAGVDFPYLQWQLIHGEPLSEIIPQIGVRWIRMLTDLPAAVGEILHGRLSLSGYLRSLRGPIEFSIFAPDDPLPALLDVPFLVWLFLERRSRRRAARSPYEDLHVRNGI